MTEQEASQWYIARDGKQTGPISDAEIKAIAQHGYFRAADLVWKPGFAEWRPALAVFKPDPAPAKPAVTPPAPTSAQPAQPAQSAPAPRPIGPSPAAAVPGPRENGSRPSWQSQPGYDPSSFDQRPRQSEAREPGSPAPAHAQASAQAQAPTSQPSSQLGPAPFSNRAPQQEASKLPVSPPYRSETTQRPAATQSAKIPAEGERPLSNRETTQRPTPRDTTQPNRRAAAPVDLRFEPEAAQPRRSHRAAIAAISIVGIALAGGIWVAAYPGVVEGLPSFKALTANMTLPTSKTSSLEARWQQTAHWPVIKREFPDWYGERLREATKLVSENKPEDEINKTLVDQMISLRRQNAGAALSASTPKLRALASAFLENLRQLKAQSTTACFNFISQGEGTPGVIDQFQASDGVKSPMQLQVAAIFDAIGEGRKSPITHEKPIKADYDALMEQLSKLGWSQTDVATFADPKALARAEPARVCQMVQDWFVAHISITDEGTQERLLGETLRPVVSG